MAKNAVVFNNSSHHYSGRYSDVDILRGYGIILMIMGHAYFGTVFSKFISSFHMPLFYILSGYCFRPVNSLPDYIRRRIKTLILPYFSYGIINYLFWILFINDRPWFEPLLALIWVNNTDELPIAGALWFLTSMFFSNVIYVLLQRIKPKFRYIIMLVLLVFGAFRWMIFDFELPWSIQSAFVGVSFMEIGRLIHTVVQNADSKECTKTRLPGVLRGGHMLDMNIIEMVFLGILFTISIFVNKKVNMRINEYAILPLSFINAVGFVIVLWNIARHQLRLNQNVFSRFIMEIGENSMIFLGFNQLIIHLFYTVHFDYAYKKIIWHLVTTVACIVLLLALSKIIKLFKIKVLFGVK